MSDNLPCSFLQCLCSISLDSQTSGRVLPAHGCPQFLTSCSASVSSSGFCHNHLLLVKVTNTIHVVKANDVFPSSSYFLHRSAAFHPGSCSVLLEVLSLWDFMAPLGPGFTLPPWLPLLISLFSSPEAQWWCFSGLIWSHSCLLSLNSTTVHRVWGAVSVLMTPGRGCLAQGLSVCLLSIWPSWWYWWDATHSPWSQYIQMELFFSIICPFNVPICSHKDLKQTALAAAPEPLEGLVLLPGKLSALLLPTPPLPLAGVLPLSRPYGPVSLLPRSFP